MLKISSPHNSIRAALPYSALLVFVCCLCITIFILARSDILFTVPWPSVLWPQVLILFAVVGSVATAIAIIAMFFRLRLEFLLALMATAMIALFCGPAPTAIVLFFLFSSACLATLLLFPFGDIEAVPFNLRIVVGWAIFGIVFTFLASVRIHTNAVHTMMLGIPILIAVAIPAIRGAMWPGFRGMFRFSDGDDAPGLLYATGLVVCIVILSFHLALVALPERYFDALVTHLYIPSFIAGHQAWNYDINNYAFAYLVMAVDFLYANVFLLGGEQAARLLNFIALLFTCISIFQIAAKTCSRTAAIWTVALFVSMPLTLIESTSLFVEHTIALFVISAALAIVLSGFRLTLPSYGIILILLAAATMSKLHGALGAVVIGTASSALYLRQRRQRSEYGRFLIVSLMAVGIALWPYIQSWRNTGNPIFPFFNRVFKSPYYSIDNFVDPRWAETLSPWLLYDTTFHSSKFLEAGDGVLGFSLFIFLAAGLVGAIYARNAIVLFCAGLGLLITGIVSLQTPYLRYLFIFTPLLMVSVAFAMNDLSRTRHWRLLVGAAAGGVVLLNVYKFPTGGWVIGTSDLRGVFDSGVRRELELGQAPERIANRVINDISGSDAKVLYLANPFGALLVGTAIYDNWYNTAYGRDFANITSTQDFETVLRRIAPTYVILDPTRDGQRYKVASEYLLHEAILVTKIGRLAIYRTSLAPK